MALQEHDRSTAYQALAGLMGEQTAAAFMDETLREPVTKDFVRTEIATLDASTKDFVRAEITAHDTNIKDFVRAEIATLDASVERRFHRQTIRLGALVGTVTVVSVAVATYLTNLTT